MKKIIAFVILLLFIKVSNGQKIEPDSTVRNKVEEQGKKMGTFLLKKDFKAFAKYTYPKLVEMIGGEDKMIEILKNSFEDLEKEGIFITNIQIGKSSNFVVYNGELQCVIEQTLEMKIPNGKMISNSSLIGLSLDEGKNWYFLDTQGKNVVKLKEKLSNLSRDLIIPERKQPTIIKD